MSSHEKASAEKIHCLYHQKTDCTCIYPVTNVETLIERLKSQIKLNEILNRIETDQGKKEARRDESILIENRLSDLQRI